jgi:putative membrane protein
MLTLLACWLGPLPELARSAFFAHMLMHMGVVAIAAPLLALSVAGSRHDPVRLAPALFAPIPASVLELLIVWAWHAPALHHLARHRLAGVVCEQGMFLLCGLLVWLAAFGGPAPRSGSRTAAGVIGLLLTSMHMTLLGALLIFAQRPLYNHGPAYSPITPLADQQLGGAIMLLVGGAAYLAGGLWLTVSLLRSPTGVAKASTV